MRCLFAILIALMSLPTQAGEIGDMAKETSESPTADLFVKFPADPRFNFGITEIGIECTACLGTCPVFTFIAKSDGTVRYVGTRNVDYLGVRTGKIALWRFNWLAKFIWETDYKDFHRAYTIPVTDHPTVYTMVVMNGQRKIVSNYGEAGPATLWAIERLINDLKAHVDWDE